ncbi:MAG TPA: FliG C-terminal domain-containing protein [Gemmataceae bacterium]|nr:FliG C-terminal domain-containing protein [Gemmataceae bacterium]
MTGQEKAALLLSRLPPPEADSVLARLDPDRGGRLRAQMQHFREAPPPADVVNQILDDLDRLIREQADLAAAPAPAAAPEGSEAAAPPAEGEEAPAGGAAPARKPGEPLPDEAVIESDPLSALREMSGAGPANAAANVDRLALALADEHPRMVALVLDKMDPDRGGEVLKRLHPEHRRAVSVQLGKEVSVNPDLVNRIIRTVLAKCRTLAETPPAAAGNRFKRMAEMLRRLDKPDRMEVLAALEQSDAQTAAQVREFLYSFDDLLIIEDRSMQKLLAEIDSKSLASALKGASDPIKEKVRSNLSKRARETLNEEMELLGALPPPAIAQAQKSVVDVIQRLDQAGELTMLQ